jgi:hypothetical protein
MSNSKKTIKVKTEFSNMYGDGQNLNIGKNKPVNELLKNIPNSNLNLDTNDNQYVNSKYDSKYDSDRKETLKVPNSEVTLNKSPITMIFGAIIIIIVLILSLLFFYKDVVINYFNTLFPKTNETDNETIKAAKNAAIQSAATTSKVETTSGKVDATSAKVDAASAKVDSTSEKIDNLDKKINNLINTKTCDVKDSGVNKLNNKLNNMSPDKKSTLSENAYCYIGYDNGQRECMEAYAGDVCMSGEIFPSLDICINPKLRP